jgi:predicted phosphoribosyltransferase
VEHYRKLEKEFQSKVNKLIEQFPELNNNWVIVSISDEGQKIIDIILQRYKIDATRFFIEPIHCEYNQDCEIAIIDEFGNMEINRLLKMSFEIDDETIERNADLILNYKIKPMIEKYRGNSEIRFSISDEVKNILIIDDHVETGFKIENAIHTFKNLFPQKNIYLGVLNIPNFIFDILDNKIEKIFYHEKKFIFT